MTLAVLYEVDANAWTPTADITNGILVISQSPSDPGIAMFQLPGNTQMPFAIAFVGDVSGYYAFFYRPFTAANGWGDVHTLPYDATAADKGFFYAGNHSAVAGTPDTQNLWLTLKGSINPSGVDLGMATYVGNAAATPQQSSAWTSQWNDVPNAEFNDLVATGPLTGTNNDNTQFSVFFAWNGSLGFATPGGAPASLVASGVPNQKVCALINGNGAREAFWGDSSGQIWHTWESGLGTESWTTETLANNYVGSNYVIAGARNSNITLEIFYVGQDGHVYHAWQVGGQVNGGWDSAQLDGRNSLVAVQAVLITAGTYKDRIMAFVLDNSGGLTPWVQQSGYWEQLSTYQTGIASPSNLSLYNNVAAESSDPAVLQLFVS